MKYHLVIFSLFCFTAVFAQEEDFREPFSKVEFFDLDESDQEIQSQLAVLKSSYDIFYPNHLIFSHEAGFFHKDFDLKIGFSSRSEDSIYYTLDGTIPSLHSNKYDGAVKFEIPPDSVLYKSFVFRARSYNDTIPSSQIVSKTFLTFKDPGDQFSFPVISLITDPANLYDYEKGIYIKGANYVSGNNWTGNYFMTGIEWERPVRMQYFTTSGEMVINQDAGIRIHGGLQRTAPQKTFRLYARDEYGEGTFDYQLLPQKKKKEYHRFLLRTSFGCWNSTIIKDPMAASLVRGLNFEIQDYRPVIIFLNGEYWGIQTIRDYMGQHHFAEQYHVDHDSVAIGNNLSVYEGSTSLYTELDQMLDSVGLTDEERMQEIAERMDINCMINYYNSEIFLNNYDWPAGNRRWWNSSEYDKGKIRWIFYDVDAAFNARGGVGNDLLKQATVPSAAWPNPPSTTRLLTSLLEIESFRDDFISRAAYLMNYYFHPDTVIPKIYRVKDEYALEMPGHLERWKTLTFPNWEKRVEESLIDFVRDRRKYVEQHYKSKFGLSGTSELTVVVNDTEMGQVYINDMPVPNSNSSGVYFNDVRIRLCAVPNPGYRLKRWVYPYSSASDTISLSLSSDSVIVVLFEPDLISEKLIKINEVMSSNTESVRDNQNEYEDWIEIYNGSDEAFNLGGYFLSDDPEIPLKWEIPKDYPDSVTIPPFGFRLFIADNEPGQGVMHCNFKLNSSGETISLLKNVSGIPVILDSMIYDELSKNDSWGRSVDGGVISEVFEFPTPGFTNFDATVNVVPVRQCPLRMYPNPSRDRVTVILDSEEQIFHQLTFFSVSGSIVKALGFYGPAKTIDISDFHPGIYFVGIQGEVGPVWKLIVTD